MKYINKAFYPQYFNLGNLNKKHFFILVKFINFQFYSHSFVMDRTIGKQNPLELPLQNILFFLNQFQCFNHGIEFFYCSCLKLTIE